MLACLLLYLLNLRPGGAQQAVSSDERSWLASAIPLIQSGALSEAETRLTAGLREFPRSAILHNALGLVYEQEKKPANAAAAYREALQILPTFTAAQIHLASLYASQGNCTQAIPLFQQAGDHTSDAEALNAVGVGLGQCKENEAALRVFEKARQGSPGSASVLYNLALAQYQAGQAQAAVGTLDRLPEGKDRNGADVLYLRGKAMQAAARSGSSNKGNQTAAEALRRACEARPSELYCNDAAVELIRIQAPLDAVQLISGLPPAVNESALLTCTLGLAEFRLGRYDEATRHYTQAIRRDAASDAPREALAFLFYLTGNFNLALATVDEALARPHPDFYLNYLKALILHRDPDRLAEALDAVDAAVSTSSRYAPAYYLRGKIHMQQSRNDLALRDFKAATALDPQFALPYYKMAQIYTRLGKPEQAHRAEQRFLQLGHKQETEVLTEQAEQMVTGTKRVSR